MRSITGAALLGAATLPSWSRTRWHQLLLPRDSIQDHDVGRRLPAMLRGTFSTIRLVWADGGYLGCLLE